MAKIPQMNVTFKQLASAVVERSERGVAILIVKDDTDGDSFKSYRDVSQIEADAAKYTAENLRAAKDAMNAAPYRLDVVRVAATGTTKEAGEIIEANEPTGWIAFAKNTAAGDAELIAWVKAREKAGKTYKCVVYNVEAPDNMHVVNFATEKVTFADERGEKDGAAYIPSLLGKIAAANIYESVTRGRCEDLAGCAETEDEEAAVSAGKMILSNMAGAVYIASGCNSLTTTDGKAKTEDMQYIETVEAMDLIADDIRTVWREQYEGAYKNSYDNQMLFIAAVTGYLRELEKLSVLDAEYENTCSVDVEAQRDAWVAAGHTEAEEWTDDKVRRTPFKRSVFITLDVKILGSMENLYVTVQMY